MAKSNETHTEEEQERIDAVNRYQRGERPSKICKSLGRSRSWLQKWVGRYNSFNKRSAKEWFKEESRAPKNVHRKTDSEIEQLVVNVRKSLMEGKTEDTKYRCIGADEIQFRMYELGYSEDETPSRSTIKRIIKRNGLVVQNPRHFSRVVRLCLHLGVEPVFIAPSKPWMNGTIEDFNRDFGEKLWEREQWTDLEHIRGEAKIFLMRHNTSPELEVQKDRSGDHTAPQTSGGFRD